MQTASHSRANTSEREARVALPPMGQNATGTDWVSERSRSSASRFRALFALAATSAAWPGRSPDRAASAIGWCGQRTKAKAWK